MKLVQQVPTLAKHMKTARQLQEEMYMNETRKTK